MTSRWIVPRSLSDFIVVALCLWFGSYAYSALLAAKGIKPLYSYFLLGGFVVSSILLRGGMHDKQGIAGTGDRYFRMFLCWLAVYFALLALSLMVVVQDASTIQVFIVRFEGLALAASFAILFATPYRMRLALLTFAFLAIFATCMCLYDVAIPTFSSVLGRGAGFYGNPNLAGLFIVSAMTAGVATLPRRWRLPFVFFCGVGVLSTFSRTAYILWGVTTVWLGWQGRFGAARRRVVVAVGIIGVGSLVMLLLFTGALGSAVEGSSLQKYLTPNTAARLGIGASVLSGRSENKREQLVFDSLDSAANAPWVGHGLGYTRKWSYGPPPHNMYLLFLVEGGIVGLLFYVALFALMWLASCGIGRIISVQLLLGAMFTHDQLIQPALLIIIALVFAHGAVAKLSDTRDHRGRAAPA